MRKRKKTARQGALDFGKGKHGGKRERAGRKKRSREVHHAKRVEFAEDSVVHVTVSLRGGLWNLRRKKEAKAIWRAITEFREGACEEDFRLLQLSIQRDHLHMAVEAKSAARLSNAMQRLQQRIGNALRRLWRVRGSVFRGRYYSRLAETPTEVRRVFSYVLGNGRHHGVWKDDSTDPFSTAALFEGWSSGTRKSAPCEAGTIVSSARSWLAKSGWKLAGRKGPLQLIEVSLPYRSVVVAPEN